MSALRAETLYPKSQPTWTAGLGWTEARALSQEQAARAPESAGIVVLHSGARLVWAEATENVRACLADIAAHPAEAEPYVAWWMARGPLVVSFALVSDDLLRRNALRELLHEARLPSRPSAI